MVFSSNGRWLFAGGGSEHSWLWEIDATDPVATARELRPHPYVDPLGSFDVALSPDSHWLVTRTVGESYGRGDLAALVELWNLDAENPETTGRVLFTGFRTGQAPMFSPDSRVLFTGFRTGQAPMFSPDSRWLVTEGPKGNAQLWNLSARDSAAVAQVLRGHFVLSVAYSPDSKWLATASLDGSTRLWDLSSGNRTTTAAVLRGHEGSVRFVAISPDGKRLVTGSDDGTVRLRELRVGALIDLARRRAGRELTQAEAEMYYLPSRSQQE